MKISLKEIEHIALLSRLEISEEEKKQFAEQLSAILDYIDKLNELDTHDIEPTSHVIPLKNVMREDIPIPSISREDALMNAPEHTDKFYRVPKIIE